MSGSALLRERLDAGQPGSRTRAPASWWLAALCAGVGVVAGMGAAMPWRHSATSVDAAVPAAAHSPVQIVNGRVRRVVTGFDGAGRSVVLSDSAAPVVRQFDDLRFMEIWRTMHSPAPIDAAPPVEPTEVRGGLAQTDGSVFRLVDYQPPAKGGQRTPMHMTSTIDYAVVVEGEIVLVLDQSEVLLRAGDVVVQRGTRHAWQNRSAKPARVAFVMMDAAFSDTLRARLGGNTLTP